MQTGGYGARLSVATCLEVLLAAVLEAAVFPGDGGGGGARTVAGGRLPVLAQAPEIFAAQVRGRLGLGGRRRDSLHGQRRGRTVDGRLVTAEARVEVAGPAAGRRALRFAGVVARGRRFARCGRGPVRQLGRRRVLDARFAAAAVHAGQRVVSRRTAGRVRLLGRRGLVLRVTGPGPGRRSRNAGRPRFSRQRRAPRQPRGRPLFYATVLLIL